MDVGNLLAGAAAHLEGEADDRQQGRQYPTRHSLSSQPTTFVARPYEASMLSPVRPSAAFTSEPRPSPGARHQKQVTFELLLPEGQDRARLPMRVMISPHDTTDSIITTVKNFYGLYEGPGLIFKDMADNILIASFDNFHHGMLVRVGITAPDPAVVAASVRSRSTTRSPRKPKLGAPFEMRPPTRSSRPSSRSASRQASRAALARSPSPQSVRGSKLHSRAHKIHDPDSYAAEDASDSDGGNASVTSSRREAHVSAEISVNNIVEGGRRKRAKFDSSELPLFVPPQVPASNSISSLSPQRRINGDNVAASPYSWSNQRTFAYNQPLPSPQSYTRPDSHFAHHNSYPHGQFAGHQPRSSANITYGPPRQSTGGILPTPEPTACSTISDEDVALQLMRLGDASNFSYGRTSTSTMDDALSGKAEAASSAEESEDVDESMPKPRQHSVPHAAAPHRKKLRVSSADSVQSSSDEYQEDVSFKGESDEIFPFDTEDAGVADNSRRSSKSKAASSTKRDSGIGTFTRVAGSKSRAPSQVKSKPRTSSVVAKTPMSPASLPSQSRKTSAASTINFQAQYGVDEEDLSSKPRCQRCRKSKKGCDRQRPCGRCKDAGIGADGCISEDEGNGRKGRYGRHMGVAVKKGSEADIASMPAVSAGGFIAPALPSLDKNKKRKR